ncbi:MAG: hypothetical protein ACW99Q_23790, partial [Candidatus Kariarchaeaceae archaeon]
MSDEETISCWACEATIPKSVQVCPNCDMPMSESSEDVEDIDSLLNDLATEKSTEEFEMPDLPEFTMDSDTSLDQDSTIDEELPIIPSFDETLTESISDDELPIIPDFDDSTPTIPDFEQDDDLIQDELEPLTPELVEDEELPIIPSFDDMDIRIEEDEDVKVDVVISDEVSLSDLSMKQLSRIFLPQLTYWTLVFIIISLSGVSVNNSNFDLDVINSNHYSLNAELFLFGWIAFLPMGWFYRYKLNQYNVKDSTLYGVA